MYAITKTDSYNYKSIYAHSACRLRGAHSEMGILSRTVAGWQILCYCLNNMKLPNFTCF